jgi:hypothetical protein
MGVRWSRVLIMGGLVRVFLSQRGIFRWEEVCWELMGLRRCEQNNVCTFVDAKPKGGFGQGYC